MLSQSGTPRFCDVVFTPDCHPKIPGTSGVATALALVSAANFRHPYTQSVGAGPCATDFAAGSAPGAYFAPAHVQRVQHQEPAGQ